LSNDGSGKLLMPFNSLSYLALLSVTVGVYWLLPPQWRRGFVLLASVGFYASWGAEFVVLPLLMAGIVFLFSRVIVQHAVRAKQWQWLGIGCALVLLIFFKYRTFVLVNLSLISAHPGVQTFSVAKTIALPMGISFYTLEAIAYLIDVRQRRLAMPKLFDLCLFFLFWPNILSGPIVRGRELMPQLGFRKPFEARFVFEGVDRVIWGLVQKNVFANLLGLWVDKGFSRSAGIPTTLDGWFLAIAFGLQIYFDFTGYTNLAIGAARLLGVTLPENFRQPYLAATPPDFWARWHMTLSRWIRDYLFFPITAKWQGAPAPFYLSLIGVMALVGLWHGAGWTFIMWGALHGTYLVLYRIYEGVKNARPVLADSRLAAEAWRAFTLVAIIVAWVPFRAGSLPQAGVMLGAMFLRLQAGRIYSNAFYLLTLFAVLFCVLEPLLMRVLGEWDEREETEGLSPFRVLVRPILYALGFMLFLIFDTNNTQFIYSQF
jgi:D-alanyl-lipoteichoic acid acyltransferase DltB (MBOAT superfamily)